MGIFQGQNILEFSARFKIYLDGFLISIFYQIGQKVLFVVNLVTVRLKFVRIYLGYIINVNTFFDTLFHRVSFGLLKAFYICFKVVNSTKSI